MNEGWKQKKLGDVCELLNRGISPKYLEEGGIRVLNQKCIRNHQIDFEPSRRHDLSSKKIADDRFIKLGDVLVNSTGTGTLGRVAQVREEPVELTTVDSHVTIVRPKKAMFHLDFFGYMLVLIEDAIKEAGEGCGGQTELARSVLAEKFFVRFPEQLSEQKRIVDFLDESLKDIAKAKANAEKNLKNGHAIFESQLNDIFNRNSNDWVNKKLRDISKINYGYTESACIEPIGPKFLRITDIQNNHVDWSTVPYCSIAPSDISKYELSEGDIVFARTGATTGKSYLITEPPNAVFASYLIRVQLDSKEIIPPFLFLFFQTSSYWDNIRAGSSGSAQGGFNATKLGELLIPYPKQEKKQQEIIAKLSELSNETKRLETIYQRKLTALDKLKKSLLHHAFVDHLKGRL